MCWQNEEDHPKVAPELGTPGATFYFGMRTRRCHTQPPPRSRARTIIPTYSGKEPGAEIGAGAGVSVQAGEGTGVSGLATSINGLSFIVKTNSAMAWYSLSFKIPGLCGGCVALRKSDRSCMAANFARWVPLTSAGTIVGMGKPRSPGCPA